MNTWQTVYEQLQEFLKQCIDMWWSPEWWRPEWFRYIECYDDFIIMVVNNIEWDIERLDMDWYHWLFSIESWIMEFVKWKQTWIALPWNLWHYMNMCQMTWEKKVKYFLENALLPN